eukprot:5997812-Alexandrium_andersonii.AAC.1
MGSEPLERLGGTRPWLRAPPEPHVGRPHGVASPQFPRVRAAARAAAPKHCLLYTSDAADDM